MSMNFEDCVAPAYRKRQDVESDLEGGRMTITAPSNLKTAKDFYDFCRRNGACREGLEKIKGLNFLEFISTTNRIDWLEWIIQLFPPLDADYQSKRDSLFADYQSKRAPLDADYQSKCDSLYADYQSKRGSLYADYQSKRDSLLRQILSGESAS